MFRAILKLSKKIAKQILNLPYKVKKLVFLCANGTRLFVQYVFCSIKQKCTKLPKNRKAIIFTLEQDRLYRDDDGMGRYAYLTLNAFSEAGYSVYLHKNVNTFFKFCRLEKYGRFIYSIKNLKFISKIPDHIQNQETIYAFDTIDQSLLKRDWKELIYVNILKPTFCKIGEVIWIPYYCHSIAYKSNIMSRYRDLRSNKRKLKIIFAGNAEERYYSSKLLKEQYNQLTRHEGLQAVLELKEKARCVDNTFEFLKVINNGRYMNECWLLQANKTTKLQLHEYWNAISKSDFFLCVSGTDLPMCHNVIEAMAVGTIPILSYADWFFPSLEHGKNAIIYSGKEDLKVKVNEILAMEDTLIQEMRKNVIQYYDKHLSNESFIREVEANNDKVKTIMLHPRYVSQQEEDRASQSLIEELNEQFKAFIDKEQETNVETAS